MTTGTPPTQTYLLAVDGSEHSYAAANMLASLICSGGDDLAGNIVYLLAVFTPVQAGDLQPLKSAVDNIEQVFLKEHIPTQTDLVLGHPAEKILEYAAEVKPVMIVMGARGLRATLGILLGGVAQQVVEYGNFPVLIVRAPFRALERILLVTDGSPCSLKATAFAAKIPLPGSANLMALHVLPPIPPQAGLEFYARSWPLGSETLPSPPPEIDTFNKDWLKEEENQGQDILSKTANTLEAAGKSIKTELSRGDAATVILDYLKTNEIDLVITGSRGLSAVKGWLLGSVSRKLVHYAPCSVLVVRETACLD